MREFLRRFGAVMTAYIFLSTAVWLLGMIVLPQILMVDYSLWHRDEVAQGEAMADIAVLEDKLDELDVTIRELTKQAREAGEDRKPTIAGRIADLEQLAEEIEHSLEPLDRIIRNPPKIYGFKNYIYLLTNSLHRSVFLKTIIVSLFMTCIALIICYPVAYYLAQTARGNKAAVIILGLAIPYWVNEILRTFAWLMILSDYGVANSLLTALGIVDAPVNFLNNNSGVIIGMAYCYVLFMVFPIYNSLDTLDHNQIEAARDLGAGWLTIHRRIAVPHAKPGIAVGCIMTFMLAVGTYAVPSILGGTRSLWFTQIIYSWFFDGGNWNQGSAYAFTLLVLCVSFVMLMLKLFKVGLEDMVK
jgi:spermidine/putrescine transport system permease protein